MHLATHLRIDELERRYRAAREPHERTWRQILWLLAKGQAAMTVSHPPSSRRTGGLVSAVQRLPPGTTYCTTASGRTGLPVAPLSLGGTQMKVNA